VKKAVYLYDVMSPIGAPSKSGMPSWANDADSMVGGLAGDFTLRQWLGHHGYGSWIAVGLHNRCSMPAATQGVNAPISGSSVSVPSGTNWPQQHDYGWRWVPATATRNGCCGWFFDQSLMGNIIERDAWTPTQQPPPQRGSPAFNLLDRSHLAWILGGGAAANSATPHSMEVRRSSAAGNLVL
jgi:hypothetical protein